METVNFGENLKKFRKIMGFTQHQLGEMAGLGQVTIANYENGKRFPGEKNLRLLSESLSVSLDSLLGKNKTDRSLADDFEGSVTDLLPMVLKDSINSSWHYLQRWSKSRGFSLLQVYIHIITPLLELTGKLWAQGKISVAEEHLISGCVRELITRSSTEMGRPVLPGKKRLWLGLCAPAEEHELGLLMNSFIVRELGWRAFNLGTHVPFSDLLSMILNLKPDVLCFSVTMDKNLNGLKQSLEILNQMKTPDFRIVLYGAASEGIQKSEFEKISITTGFLREAFSYYQGLNEE